MADGTDAPKDLIGFLEYHLVTNAPFQLPDGVRTVLAAIVPWLVLLGTVLAVPGILIMLGIGTFAVPFGVAYVPGLGIATIAAIAGFVLNALALPGLFGRGMAGWTWIFYGELVSIASSLLRGAVVSAVIGGLIGLYLLFQIKREYR
jgi:hypothetical protein